MSHHVLHMADGSVAIMQTVGEADPAECVGKWPEERRASIIDRTPIDPATIPADRTFRNAWTHDGQSFGHDMAKARDIHRDRIRRDRMPVLAHLDVAYQRAEEVMVPNVKDQIVALKQRLRDAPSHPAIEAAKTPDDLKALTIERLTNGAD